MFDELGTLWDRAEQSREDEKPWPGGAVWASYSIPPAEGDVTVWYECFHGQRMRQTFTPDHDGTITIDRSTCGHG